jgi:hypothetical protein
LPSAFEELLMLISSHTGMVSIAELSEGCNCVRLGWGSVGYRGLTSEDGSDFPLIFIETYNLDVMSQIDIFVQDV